MPDPIFPPSGPVSQAEPIRMRTLVLLRWFAIAGQMAAVVVAYLMGIGFAILPVLALGISLFGLARARMSEDFLLGQLDPGLMAEDQRVRARANPGDIGRAVARAGVLPPAQPHAVRSR